MHAVALIDPQSMIQTQTRQALALMDPQPMVQTQTRQALALMDPQPMVQTQAPILQVLLRYHLTRVAMNTFPQQTMPMSNYLRQLLYHCLCLLALSAGHSRLPAPHAYATLPSRGLPHSLHAERMT